MIKRTRRTCEYHAAFESWSSPGAHSLNDVAGITSLVWHFKCALAVAVVSTKQTNPTTAFTNTGRYLPKGRLDFKPSAKSASIAGGKMERQIAAIAFVNPFHVPLSFPSKDLLTHTN